MCVYTVNAYVCAHLCVCGVGWAEDGFECLILLLPLLFFEAGSLNELGLSTLARLSDQ